jgi:hypothetical protein
MRSTISGRQQMPWLLSFLESVPDSNKCWPWAGQINAAGYGVAGGPLAHRKVYEVFYRPIPEGLQLDHLCKNTRCVNPKHLRVIAPDIHGSLSSKYQGRTHCSRGHAYTAENTRWRQPPDQTNPSRECLTCKREGERARRARRS